MAKAQIILGELGGGSSEITAYLYKRTYYNNNTYYWTFHEVGQSAQEFTNIWSETKTVIDNDYVKLECGYNSYFKITAKKKCALFKENSSERIDLSVGQYAELQPSEMASYAVATTNPLLLLTFFE